MIFAIKLNQIKIVTFNQLLQVQNSIEIASIFALLIKQFEFEYRQNLVDKSMGNQSSNQMNKSNISLQNLVKDNKHFSNSQFKVLSKDQLIQILPQLQCQAQNGNKFKKHQQLSLNSMQITDHFSIDKTNQRLLSRMGLELPHILNVRKIKVQQYKNLCSMTIKVYICLDGYDFTLKSMIMDKYNKKAFFSEQQIIVIMSRIVKAVIWMHDNQFRNVPLDAESILFVRDSKQDFGQKNASLQEYQCKIIDQDITQINCYRQFLEDLALGKNGSQNQKGIKLLSLYLSPELLQQAKLVNSYPTSNVTSKSDIFTLGMLMMQLCCQQEMYFCYDLQSMAFDYESLIHRIAKISYSNKLKLLLAEMLEYDQNNRIGFVSLNEKISQLRVKPLEETRKLKRRSSSTMLKELLSCSRASESADNKLDNKRQAREVKSKQTTPLNQSTQRNEQSTKHQQNEHQNQPLRKSSSMVSLKCKPNSFLTNRKSNLTREGSSSKLVTENKKAPEKMHNLQDKKIDYRSVIKNRTKTQPKIMECPRGDNQKQEQSITNSQFVDFELKSNDTNKYSPQSNDQARVTAKAVNAFKVQNISQSGKYLPSTEKTYESANQQILQQSDASKLNPSTDRRKPSVSKFSYVQKKVINLDKINLSSSDRLSTQKLRKSKSALMSSHQRKTKEEVQNTKNNQNGLSQGRQPATNKLKSKQTSLSVKKMINLKQADLQKNRQKEQTVSNKNWIIQKLKNKNIQSKKTDNFSHLPNLQMKPSDENRQTSLAKQRTSWQICAQLPKTVQERVQTGQANKAKKEQSQDQYPSSQKCSMRKEKGNSINSTSNKNDTIIKRLELTQQKQGQLVTSRHQQNIKDQLQMIDKFLQKLDESSSRVSYNGQASISNIRIQTVSLSLEQRKPDITTSADTQGRVKYSDFTQSVNKTSKGANQPMNNQFKKKCKIIDIDLGDFSKQAVDPQNKRQQIVMVREQKRPSSKLQRLKQLTIFTEQEPCESLNQSKNHAFDNYEDRNKQNSMKMNNLPANIEHEPKQRKSQQKSNSLTKEQNKFDKQQTYTYLNIPYQRIEYLNVALINQQSVNTPNNMNELNKLYGKGTTLQSIEEAQYGHRRGNSTLTKPFQQIQLDYFSNSPQTNELELRDYFQEKPKQTAVMKELTTIKGIALGSMKSQNYGSIIKENPLYQVNAEQLTFRLKHKTPQSQDIKLEGRQTQRLGKVSQLQKVNYFERQDGSFVMRQENPLKDVQAFSVIGQSNAPRNTVEQLFKQSSHFDNNLRDKYQGYKQSFYGDDQGLARSERMNSSCNSINLSQIQYAGHRNSQFLFNQNEKQRRSSEKGRKYKQISILYQLQQTDKPSRDLNINIKRINEQSQNNLNLDTNRQSQYNTYRKYLSSNRCNSKVIQLDGDFIYEGQVNQQGQFQGNGMISRKSQYNQENLLIYTGSFYKGLYHGFGTLYEIQNPQAKVLKLPNNHKRISFGALKSKLPAHPNNRHCSLSPLPTKYEGQFIKGCENGFGSFTYENEDKFSGCIKEGVIQGYGTYYFAYDNQTICGIWKNNAYVN